MCGRYAITLPPEAMRDLFRTLNSIDYPARYNIAPTQPVVTVLNEHGRRVAKLMRWGMVPGWVKDPREFPLLINARSETMAEKPAFRDALKNSRCVVPASGYFEWHTGPDKQKQPYFVTRADGQPMALAGLYSVWAGPNGEEVDTTAIVTVPAADDISHLHDRMPAILEGEAVERWLDTGEVRAHEASTLIAPSATGTVCAHAVSKAVGSNRVDTPDLIVPITLEPEAPVEPKRPAAKKRAAAGGGGQLDLF